MKNCNGNTDHSILQTRIEQALPIHHYSNSKFLEIFRDRELNSKNFEYRLCQSDPAFLDGQYETAQEGVTIQISWGRNMLLSEHVSASSSFHVGENLRGQPRCNFVLPKSVLGHARVALLIDGTAVVPTGAKGTLSLNPERSMSLQEAVAEGIATLEADGYHIVLPQGARLSWHQGAFRFELLGENSSSRFSPTFAAVVLLGGLWTYLAGSGLVHAGVLFATAALMPPLGDTHDDGMSDEQRYRVQAYLDAAAEKERQAEQGGAGHTTDGGATDSQPGERAKGASGTMGNPKSSNVNKRSAVRKTSDLPARLARESAIEDASQFGIIPMIHANLGGDMGAPTAAWATNESNGYDPLSANGNMWSDDIGDAYGVNGLDLDGLDDGGGHFGEAYGLNQIGTIGAQGGCPGCLPGNFGRRKPERGNHRATAPRIRTTGTAVQGRLPKAVIQRIVRNNYGVFRACYQNGLRSNPSLQGRVLVRFIIGRDGRVAAASGAGDLADPSVISCVSRSFHGLSFPAPESGTVTVNYPLILTPVS